METKTTKYDRFRAEFEKKLSSDPISLDNISKVEWSGDGYYLIMISPKAEEVFKDTVTHILSKIASYANDLNFKALHQQVIANGVKSVVVKVSPV